MTGAVIGSTIEEIAHGTNTVSTSNKRCSLKKEDTMGGLVLGSSMIEIGQSLNEEPTTTEDAMGGVVLGSSMTEAAQGTSVALTINNRCNLECPHCYLQQVAPYCVISEETIRRMFLLEPVRVIVVGMEPLVNKESMDITTRIAKEARSKNVQFAFMTNGLNLSTFLTAFPQVVPLLHHIDISVDAGDTEHYRTYRGGDFGAVLTGIRQAIATGIDVRILNVINDRTCGLEHIENVMRSLRKVSNGLIMFSPFMATEREVAEEYAVFEIGLRNVIRALQKSRTFMLDTQSTLLIDQMHCLHENTEMRNLKEVVDELGMQEKVHFVDRTSDELGIVRITCDGYRLTSDDALHTARYKEKRIVL